MSRHFNPAQEEHIMDVATRFDELDKRLISKGMIPASTTLNGSMLFAHTDMNSLKNFKLLLDSQVSQFKRMKESKRYLEENNNSEHMHEWVHGNYNAFILIESKWHSCECVDDYITFELWLREQYYKLLTAKANHDLSGTPETTESEWELAHFHAFQLAVTNYALAAIHDPARIGTKLDTISLHINALKK